MYNSPWNYFLVILSITTLLCLVILLGTIIFRVKPSKILLNNMAKLLLLLGSVTALCYLVENLLQLTGNEIERYMFLQRVASLEHGWAFWTYLLGTGGVVQLFWSAKNRQKTWMVFVVASIVLFCQWISRYLIVVVMLVNPA